MKPHLLDAMISKVEQKMSKDSLDLHKELYSIHADSQ